MTAEAAAFLRTHAGATPDDVLAVVLPLFRQVAEVHAAGRVAPLQGLGALHVAEGRLYFESAAAHEPRLVPHLLRKVAPDARLAFDVVGRRAQTTDADDGEEEHRDLLVAEPGAPVERPVYLAGYQAWEHALGHHDALTDMFVLGLLLASVATGLDLGTAAGMRRFAAHRGNLFALRPGLNPVLARHVLRLTELDRHRRAQDLDAVVRSLEGYRDQQVDLDLDLSRIPGFHSADVAGRRKIVLSRLRERLFEVTRRNRLVYFKPTLQTLNLTFASVPILLDVRNVRPEQVFTWQAEVERLLADGTPIPLNRYLRFEDAPYVPNVLDKLISEVRRDTAEYGFSQLRLVIAFLRWHNLKEAPGERIDSPLLLLPVELTKKRGVRDSYVLRATQREAEVNPVLRYHLQELYGIQLPHAVDLGESTLQAFHDVLAAQIQASEPGVLLERLDRPQVDLVYAKARRRLDQYRRRLRIGGGLRAFGDLDYSYSRDNFQPLGLRLFVSVVRPSPAALHDLARTDRPVHEARMSAVPGPPEKEKQFVSMREGSDAGNPYRWDFDLCNLTLGNFNYRKMSLVRDYDSLLKTDQQSAPFDAIFSLAPREVELPGHGAPVDLAERFPVVSCDPTQLRAIAAADSGRSYVIQGPPGTGKSQTITNLIADLLARGKRVLFVCEKRAAIDVVYHRLKQRGLHELVCLIHDSQADKREFVMDLKATYERLLRAGLPAGAGDARRQASLHALRRELAPLERVASLMTSVPAQAGVGLRTLLVRAVELGDDDPGLDGAAQDRLPRYHAWVEHRDTLEALRTRLATVRPDAVYARHPLAALAPGVAALDRARTTVDERLRRALQLLGAVPAALADGGVALGDGDTLGRALGWARHAVAVKPLADRGLLGLLDPRSATSQRLQQDRAREQQLDDALGQAEAAAAGWRSRLDRADAAMALERARGLQGPLRFFSGDYWALRKLLNERYDFGRHAVKPTFAWVLERLVAVDTAREELARFRAGAHATWGPHETLGAFDRDLAGIRDAVRDLAASGGAGTRPPVLDEQTVEALLSLDGVLREIDGLLDGVLEDARERTLGALRDEIRGVLAALDQLPGFLPCLGALRDLRPDLARAVRTLPLRLDELEAAMVSATLDDVLQEHRGEAELSAGDLETHAARAERHHAAWLEGNAQAVVEATQRRFLSRVAEAGLPSVRLSREQDEAKRRYNAGRRELEHEFGKTMRFKSVRGLLSGPAGEVIQDLKPVWLMSPLSVSDTLPIDARAFDVVIFDEASQVPLEESVPALFRADQVIVSGDQMQLPPTSFFSARRTADETLLEDADDGAEVVEDDLDANSFLSHAARNLASTMLGWHYRSRSESLISFSNAAFYEGRLLTVPERRVGAGAGGDIRVAEPGEGEVNVGALLSRPVSFHHLPQSRYEQRRNPGEAAYIAHLVRGLLHREPRPTIGIVAFSEAQQGAIEAALDRLAATDAAFRARLEEEYEREEDGQFAGLLVKNLENIQGDERDVILLSVCYGPGPDGRMLMNFGPINQGGGEKRLNVAFSRAKRHMAVVGSIRYADVKNVYNDGANALRSYLQYAEAMSAGDLAGAAVVLRAMNPAHRAAPAATSQDAVVAALAHALRAAGYEVETGAGQSHFRCHLAVRRPGDGEHRLAVFVDTDEHLREGEALEREVLRPRLLRDFGWHVCTVTAKDWRDDAADVVRRLERRLEHEDELATAAADADAEIAAIVVPEAPPAAPVAEAPAGEPEPQLALPLAPPATGPMRCFEFREGGSSKFWQVSVDGAELVVAWGRIGTDGQVKRKPFPTAALAHAEAARLVREKLAKGYAEVTPSAG